METGDSLSSTFVIKTAHNDDDDDDDGDPTPKLSASFKSNNMFILYIKRGQRWID